MKAETGKNTKKKMPQILFVVCMIGVFTYVLYQRGYIPAIAMLVPGEAGTLEFARDIVEVDASKNQEFIVNEDQIIWVTEDGIKAMTIEGEEIWADTHTLDNISIAQRAPYFAVSHNGSNTVSIFDTYGKKTDVDFANPVIYFSLNKQGDLVVIESTRDGHVVSAYDEKGHSLGVKRVTYIQDVGHPTVAEISPDGKMILIAYLNTADAQITSNIIAMEIGSGEVAEADNILYGETYQNTIISEIEFINQNTWVAIGDNSMIFNAIDGSQINKISNMYYNFAPVLTQIKDWQGIHYPVISTTKPIKSTVHPVEQLMIYSQKGEEVERLALEGRATYMYADGRITIIGRDRDFTAYNRTGKKSWEYTATKDIIKMIPLNAQHQVIMISKGKVELMQVAK